MHLEGVCLVSSRNDVKSFPVSSEPSTMPKEPGTPKKSPVKTPSKKAPQTPKSSVKGEESPMKKPPKTPKSSFKGDELGKNKKQSSLLQFFTPKDKESPIQLVVKPKVKAECPSRKLLFPSVSDPIVISDEDSPRLSPQPTIDQFHGKTKSGAPPKTPKCTQILSRKSRKLKSPDYPSNLVSEPSGGKQLESNSTTDEADDVVSISSSHASQNDSNSPLDTYDSHPRNIAEDSECSPSKKFRKQSVVANRMVGEVESDVLKVITPNTKSSLSTKFRKRKTPESSGSSEENDVSPLKKPKCESTKDVLVTGSPRESVIKCVNSLINGSGGEVQSRSRSLPRGSSPRTDPSEADGLRKDTSPTPKGSRPRIDDLDENDSCQIFLKSPLRPSPIPKVSNMAKPSAIRVRALPELLSPRYLTEEMLLSVPQPVPKHPANSTPTGGLASSRSESGPPGKATSKSVGAESIIPGVTSLSKTKDSKSSKPVPTAAEKPTIVSKTVSACDENVLTPKSSSSNSTAPNPSVDSLSPISTARHTSGAVPTEDVTNVDWSEPMEQEILHSPAKKPPSTNTTPKKINPAYYDKPSPVKFGTPSKVPTTPSKNLPSTSRSTPITPRKSPYKSPKKTTPKKFGSPFKTDLTSGNLLLQHCIEECKRYARMALKLNAANKQAAEAYLSLDHPEKMLLHHLLMRKWSWIRGCDMKYDKFIQRIDHSLDALRDKGFLDSIGAGEDLAVLLGELKRPELVELCKMHKVDFSGTKNELNERLLKFANRQSGLGFTRKTLKTAMHQTALKMVGQCVRISESPRQALQQIFEACMSPVFLDGSYYTFQQRMRGMEQLMDEVKFKNKKLIPFELSNAQLFLSTSQFDEYISSAILKFNLLAAKEEKDIAKGIELAKEARIALLMYVDSPTVVSHLEKMPRYAWRYTAGSNYTSALHYSVEFFKKDKDFDNAVVALDILLGQEKFRKHCRGNWYAEKVLILDKHLKVPPGTIFNVIITGLKEDLTPIGRLELSKKAEILLKKKKNGLEPPQIDELRRLMKVPRLNHPVREIKSTEAPNMSTGTRQTYVEVSADGERTYSNVEQTARNAYLEAYPEGMHDEGSFLKNIILAAFWPVVYASKDEMFVSKYQHSPLDWGTRAFYTNRQQEISAHLARLREGGIDGVLRQITDVITEFKDSHSLINWFYITHDMLPTIKNIITCLTLDKFLLLAVYLLEAFRERRSGWPDLTLWNSLTRSLKLVEVKSPNDELSFKQIVWLEKFMDMGIPVEECHVNASNKNKRRKAVAASQNSDASQEVL